MRQVDMRKRRHRNRFGRFGDVGKRRCDAETASGDANFRIGHAYALEMCVELEHTCASDFFCRMAFSRKHGFQCMTEIKAKTEYLPSYVGYRVKYHGFLW